MSLLQAAAVLAQDSNYTLREDPLGYDSALEIEHIYKGQWPTGIAVSKSGRKFSCFPAGLDILNTNNGLNGAYQVAELTGFDTETAYPNVSYNNPPGGSVDYTKIPAVTKGLSDYLLGVQSVVIDYDDVLWILDTGRVQSLANLQSPMLPASPGGTKLISVDLSTNTVTRTYTFPTTVAYEVIQVKSEVEALMLDPRARPCPSPLIPYSSTEYFNLFSHFCTL